MKNILAIRDSFSRTAVTIAIPIFCLLISTSCMPAHAQDFESSVGTLRITTHVINDNGGTKEASDFSNCIDTSNENSQTCSALLVMRKEIHKITFDAGNYKVTSDSDYPLDGYTVTYSANCSGVIGNGQTKVCTVTYNDIASPIVAANISSPAA